MLRQGFSVDADLVADRARLRRCSSNQCRVLLGSVCPQTAIRREALAADVAEEGPALGAFRLSVMISQMLLQVGQLDEGASAVGQVALVGPLARVQPRVLLHVRELLEAALAVRALVRLLARVDAHVLRQLVRRRERLEALAALVRLQLVAVRLARVLLHRGLVGQDLQAGRLRRTDGRTNSLVNLRIAARRLHLEAVVHSVIFTKYSQRTRGRW